MAPGHGWENGELYQSRLWTISFFVLGCFLRGYESTTLCDHGDRASLLEFKAGLIYNGLPFSSWNASTNCCVWSGVNCSSAGRVQGLTVEGDPDSFPTKDPSYKGVVGETLGNLTALETLNLTNVSFHGSLPASWGHLSKLTTLAAIYCNFTGGIPREYGQLTELVSWVILQDPTSEQGAVPPILVPIPLPTEVCNLTKLETVYLNGLGLSGELPSCLDRWKRILLLDFSGNNFQGPIPEWLSNLTTLTELDASNNHLDGVIPMSLFALPNLRVLNLSLNYLTSELPSTAPSGLASSLSTLLLQQNRIYGSISDSFCTFFSNLTYLDLSSNNLSGGIPPSMGESMPNLVQLLLSNNSLTGVLPTSLFNLSATTIALSHNILDGSIPSFGNSFSASEISYLDLSDNRLTGHLPEFLNFSSLQYLKLGNNRLSGEIPNFFGSCDRLKTLCLRNNTFRGTLPASLQECSQLTVLDLGGNELGGSLPLWVNTFASTLRVFMIGSNDFYGVLPRWLSNFTIYLQVLDFSNNKFSGPIPPSFSELKGLNYQLGQTLPGGTLFAEHIQISAKGQSRDYLDLLSATTSLDLSGNEIDGEIPAQLGELHGLLFLNLSCNNLSGSIPTTFANLTALESLDLSSNQLSGAIPSQMDVDLDSLGYLNVSDNLLSGKIPYKGKFTTFNSSSFAGNPGLYGEPLVPDTRLHPPSSSSESHESPISFPAFGVGVSISFSLLSSVLLPRACAGGRKAKADRIVPERREPYGVSKPGQ